MHTYQGKHARYFETILQKLLTNGMNSNTRCWVFRTLTQCVRNETEPMRFEISLNSVQRPQNRRHLNSEPFVQNLARLVVTYIGVADSYMHENIS